MFLCFQLAQTHMFFPWEVLYKYLNHLFVKVTEADVEGARESWGLYENWTSETWPKQLDSRHCSAKLLLVNFVFFQQQSLNVFLECYFLFS